jgi:hypothetical protein
VVDDGDQLTIGRGTRRAGVLDRHCTWMRCQPQLGAGIVSWRNAGPRGATVVHAVRLSPHRRRLTWSVHGTGLADVVQAHTAHHLLLAVPTPSDETQLLVARLP